MKLLQDLGKTPPETRHLRQWSSLQFIHASRLPIDAVSSGTVLFASSQSTLNIFFAWGLWAVFLEPLVEFGNVKRERERDVEV